MSESTEHVFERFQHGDDSAADELFHRYLQRLTALARTRLSPTLARRVEADDIVQSAYRSFFVGAHSGRFAIERSGALWALLVKITMRKLYRAAAHHSADKRDVRLERDFIDQEHPVAWQAVKQPTPDEAVAVSELLKAVMASLPCEDRRMLELRLQGDTMVDIAAETGRSERTVRRALKKIEEGLGDFCDWQLPSLDSIERTIEPREAHVVANSDEAMTETDPPAIEGSVIRHASKRTPVLWKNLILEKQIGFGGMAKVYRATDRETGQVRAVKFLRKSFHRHPDAIERFLREAEIIGRLDHPNVVSIYGLGETPGGGLFIVMEYIEHTADCTVDGRPSFEQAISWTIESAKGIQHAHQRGVIHCDLKPSNILIADQAVVTDFGLARSAAGDQHICLSGTAAFMAPEQIDRYWGPVSERTDIYGLGAVLFTLLSDRPPVVGSRTADILTATMGGATQRRPSDFRKHANRQSDNEWASVDSICERCLNRDPGKRFRSVEELVVQLSAIG